MHPESSFWISPNCPEIEKITMTSQFAGMTPSSNFFEVVLFLLPSLVTGPSFNVNLIIGSGVLTILFYKELTRNLEIRNTLIWVLPNIWRPGRVRYTKFVTNDSNEMLQNAGKCQGYSFYCFWVIKGKPPGG